MFEFKLQFGCLIIVAYFIIAYIRGTSGKNKMSCNKLFDLILIFTPWAIVFDGITAWTVNHQDVVSDNVNMICHGVFFVLMDLLIVLMFFYMITQTVDIRDTWVDVLAAMPGVISFFFIVLNLNKLTYVYGDKTNYSEGISATACYISLIIHFLMIIILLVVKRRTIEMHKLLSIMSYMILIIIILSVQVIWKESLVSAMLPTLSVIMIYANFENPHLRRLHNYNNEIVTGFATLVENRDNNTGGHIKRTKEYVRIIIHEMRKHPKYEMILTKDYISNVLNAAPMHDIGKISTPDYILQKPGKLTDEEYAIMKKHSEVGGEIIKETFAELDEPDYLKVAYEVARYHHEKWNGRGYPEGLAGEEIPLHARIMAIADVFDAISAKRVYRDAMPLDKCFAIMEEGVGTDFDPELARMFIDARPRIEKLINSVPVS